MAASSTTDPAVTTSSDTSSRRLWCTTPCTQQYLLLPPIPDDLAASPVSLPLIERDELSAECFLAPSSDDEEEETSFRVIWMLLLKTKPIAAVFSSSTGQWRAITSLIHSDSLPDFLLSMGKVLFVSRHYAHGCFYWVTGISEKLLVLNIRTMEFSMVDHPPCAPDDEVAIMEAGQGMTLMFVPKPDTDRRVYTVWRKNGGSSTQWQMENEPFLLDSGYLIEGAVGRHLLLHHFGSSSVKAGCYTQDIDTFQLEWVCDHSYRPDPSEAYCNFPPSLLSFPTVPSGTHYDVSENPLYYNQGQTGTRHADVHGVAGDVLVPEVREADRGGVQGPVVAADAQAPGPFFVVEGTPHADVVQGAGVDVPVPELPEADPEGMQGPVVAAAARAPDPLLVVDNDDDAEAGHVEARRRKRWAGAGDG